MKHAAMTLTMVFRPTLTELSVQPLLMHEHGHFSGPPTMTAPLDDTSRPRRSSLTSTLLILLGFCLLVSLSINWIHGVSFSHHAADTPLARAMNDFKQQGNKAMNKMAKNEVENIKSFMARAMKDFQKDNKAAKNEIENEEEQVNAEVVKVKEEEVVVPPGDDVAPSTLAGLNCDAFGGPSREEAQEMVYWSDIPSDSRYVSPFHEKRGQHRRYLTFEPDGGGWYVQENVVLSCLIVL